jgi:hypothetical protein
MAEGTQATADLLRSTLDEVGRMEQQLRLTQKEVQGLGFLARGFVQRDISSNTGRGYDEWIAAAGRLHATLTRILSGLPAVSSSADSKTIAEELRRLGTLRAYLEDAPKKVQMVPGAVLKPQQRGEFLGMVAQQVEALKGLEANLAAIERALGSGG